jgi:hypothetical protein
LVASFGVGVFCAFLVRLHRDYKLDVTILALRYSVLFFALVRLRIQRYWAVLYQR